ncbi:hypothetical protein DBR42_10450 [Pelomonas sp. HMWF004]|nr:hypothetical protein DBR42_10450 [Pelomonas sp. HMWF004]
MQDLVGLVALVTGGTTGIGLAAGKRFAERGAKVVLAARDQEQGRGSCECNSLAQFVGIVVCCRP